MSFPDISIVITNHSISQSNEPLAQVTGSQGQVKLFGQVDFIVNYETLEFERPTADDICTRLLHWANSDALIGDVHILTELSGQFIIIFLNSDGKTYLYRSDEFGAAIYYTSQNGQLTIDTSWLKLLKKMGKIAINHDNLAVFLKAAHTQGDTFFEGLHILKQYSLYRLDNLQPTLMAHTYPGFHISRQKRREMTVDDYLKAVGAYKPHFDSFSVALSGGVDSRGLATLYNERIKDVVTYTLSAPYKSIDRVIGLKQGEAVAAKLHVPFHGPVVDFTDTAMLESVYQHYIRCNPFTAFPAFAFYAVSKSADSGVILNGQAADNMWDWGYHELTPPWRNPSGTTSAKSLSALFLTKLRSPTLRGSMRHFLKTFVSRYVMMKSYRSWRLRSITNLHWKYGAEFAHMEPFPYKAFTLGRYLTYTVRGETSSWKSAAQCFGKIGLMPYCSPLALFVNSHVPRKNFFDLKSEIRQNINKRFPPLGAVSKEEGKRIVAQDPDDYHHIWELPYLKDVNLRFDYSFLDDRSQAMIRKAPVLNTGTGCMTRRHLSYLFTLVETELSN